MAMGWMASFKNIRWKVVLSVAPSIVDGARQLWNRVASKESPALKPAIPLDEKVYSRDPAISSIETQIQALELRAGKLGEDIVLSSELIDKLAEQQSQLVQAVEILRARTRALLWVCGLLCLTTVALIYLAVGPQ